MNQHASARVVFGGIALVILLVTARPAWAQAWTPLQGEGTVSVQFQDAFVKYHQIPTVRLDTGHIRGETVLVDFTYGITDRVAVSVSLPWVASQYHGPRPHQLPIDDGSHHPTFQDFRFDVRYNVTRKNVVVTPFMGTILPSHGYEYFAHSAVGRNVRELQVGTNWAALLDSVPGLFVQGRCSYGFAERIVDISHNRSNLDLEAGYFITDDLRMFALGAAQLTHGGVDLFGGAKTLEILGPLKYPHHDQIARENFLNVGVGAGYSLTPSMDVFGSVIHTVAGRNMHALQYSLTVGASWSFVTRRARARASRSSVAENRSDAQPRVLARCVCQKGK
jgi:hypothetical protein